MAGRDAKEPRPARRTIGNLLVVEGGYSLFWDAMALEEDRRKRRFDLTTEPHVGTRIRKHTKKLGFVVQKHRAGRPR